MSKFYKNKVALFLVCALTLSSETSAMESGNRFVYCQNLGPVFLSASNREILEKMLSILGSYESLELSNLNPMEFGFFLDEESLSKLSAKAVYNCTNILKSLENGYKLRQNESLEFKNNSVNFGGLMMDICLH